MRKIDKVAEQKKTAIELLQAPFDEKYRITREYTQPEVIERGENLPDEPPSTFPEAVYAQRLDDVFGIRWNVEIEEGNYKITVDWSSKNVIRMGSSFKEACEQFGVGRYLHQMGRRYDAYAVSE